MLRMIICGLIFLITLGLIMVRPRRVTEAIAAASGALLMLLGGYVGFGEALTLVCGQWNVYGFSWDYLAFGPIASNGPDPLIDVSITISPCIVSFLPSSSVRIICP